MSLEEEISARNTSEGLHILFIYVNDVVSIFVPGILFAFFMIIFAGSFFLQKREFGVGDAPVSFLVAGFATTVGALLMSLIAGLINTTFIIISFSVMVIGAMWVFFSRDK